MGVTLTAINKPLLAHEPKQSYPGWSYPEYIMADWFGTIILGRIYYNRLGKILVMAL